MYQPPYSVLKPLRYKVGGPSEVFASSGAAVFCAGMNPLSLKDLVMGSLLLAVHAGCLLVAGPGACLQFARCWLGACNFLDAGLLGARCLMGAC